MSLSFDEIAEILKILDSSSCEELIIETGGMKLMVRRGAAGREAAIACAGELPRPMRREASSGTASSTAHPRPAPLPSAPGDGASPRRDGQPGQIEVTAPMVGTFYRAPSPGAPPFVEIGSFVEEGQPLCLIEVMKLFTTIYAEQEGRVAQIGAENGEFVEYGGMLFVLEPA
ncbi:MAG: acetyl-CoA carboxylase biotin carboxyl carrier protein [Hyphomicrobiales bacterium]